MKYPWNIYFCFGPWGPVFSKSGPTSPSLSLSLSLSLSSTAALHPPLLLLWLHPALSTGSTCANPYKAVGMESGLPGVPGAPGHTDP